MHNTDLLQLPGVYTGPGYSVDKLVTAVMPCIAVQKVVKIVDGEVSQAYYEMFCVTYEERDGTFSSINADSFFDNPWAQIASKPYGCTAQIGIIQCYHIPAKIKHDHQRGIHIDSEFRKMAGFKFYTDTSKGGIQEANGLPSSYTRPEMNGCTLLTEASIVHVVSKTYCNHASRRSSCNTSVLYEVAFATTEEPSALATTSFYSDYFSENFQVQPVYNPSKFNEFYQDFDEMIKQPQLGFEHEIPMRRPDTYKNMMEETEDFRHEAIL